MLVCVRVYACESFSSNMRSSQNTSAVKPQSFSLIALKNKKKTNVKTSKNKYTNEPMAVMNTCFDTVSEIEIQ